MSEEGQRRRRIHLQANLNLAEAKRLAEDPAVAILQTPVPLQDAAWDLINEEVLSRRPDIEMRVYGFYGLVCDLSFLKRMTNLRRFSADCLHKATGVEYVTRLEGLESLAIGIWNLENFDFLGEVPPGLTALALAATKSKKPRVDVLRRFKGLKRLYLEGQQNGIEAIAELSELERLTLRSISTAGIDYVKPLDALWSLEVKLGGIRDFSALEERENLKYLELWQIRGLRDLSFISSLRGLQYLFLQSLRNVIAIPDLSALSKLRRIYLENMKALVDVSALQTAPALRQFIHVSAQNMQPEQYQFLGRQPTLEQVSVGFGSSKKNSAFRAMMEHSGKSVARGGKFAFD